MNTNLLTLASHLPDRDLLTRLEALAGKERETLVELIAHLAVLDARPSVHAAKGYGSLFSYCTQALKLSEDVTCNRIAAARICRRFPKILDLLASGALSLGSIRLLSAHLTAENHEAVLARAAGSTRCEIEALIAELAPRPDVPATVRKLPTMASCPTGSSLPAAPATTTLIAAPAESAPPALPPTLTPPVRRPVIEATSPDRYRVQFTIGKETHERLRRLQALLRREIPDGNPAEIFDRALGLLLERVEKQKLGIGRKRSTTPSIRPGTDRKGPRAVGSSRDIPDAVRAGAFQRDGGQCAYVSKEGRRCTERTFLEFHHIKPFALGGEATIENISLRCRRHNQYEAELVFGTSDRSRVPPLVEDGSPGVATRWREGGSPAP